MLAAVLVGLAAAGGALAGASGPRAGTASAAPESRPATAAAPARPPAPAGYYGALVLIPPIATIVLALLLRQVIPALSLGVLVAAFMLVPCRAAAEAYGGGVIGGLRLAVETYLIGALADRVHLKIIVFTLTIGGMVGIIAANGGTAAVVNAVARWASRPRHGQLAAWAAGLVIFFDDYANAMIVGPAMRPICDRLRISRAKLAYIVDSTAAPVASLALIGTWVGAEIGFIQDGLDQLGRAPALLGGLRAYNVFLGSIPYRFYAILALVMVLVVGCLGRDFGPMRRAEAAARSLPAGGQRRVASPTVGRAWYALLPVLVLVLGTLGLLVASGWPQGGPGSLARPGGQGRWLGFAQQVLGKSDPYNSILYGALAALAVALLISLLARAASLGRCVAGATDSMSRMFPTMVVLVLAWSLSAAMNDLQLGQVAREMLQAARFDPTWLPLLIFVAACVVSFATGTSWGTMGILCPATVTIAAGLIAHLPPAEALPLFHAAVGAVLAGAVFGDHCSPISDTTVLSALASECSLEEHVWTQIPYALTVALVSILCGELFCRRLGHSAWVGLLAGAAALLLIVLLVGRRPAPAPSGAST